MIITLTRQVAQKIGYKHFGVYGVTENNWAYKDTHVIKLPMHSENELECLITLFNLHKDLPDTEAMVHDIRAWLDAVKNKASGKANTVQDFAALIKKYLAKTPGHRIFKRWGDNRWLCYYVYQVTYHPPTKYNSAHCDVSIAYDMLGGRSGASFSFYKEDVQGRTVAEALAMEGYLAETPDLRALYMADLATFKGVIPQIGHQFNCVGTATDDMDGNPDSDDNDSWWRKRTNQHYMAPNGKPSRVVIDVFYEETKTKKTDNTFHINQGYWSPDGVAEVTEDEGQPRAVEVEIPIHPFVAIFDMTKHLRLKVHVGYLKRYEYDRNLMDKLIIPDDMRGLVKLLINHKDGGFNDVIKGKSGGAVVLLAGPPGVGKTLTAEVFAESEARPLYTVQCSQLGTNAVELEDQLLKVFARAGRWNAVMLLDEADVYVRARGNDLQQNAIVGVFLRTLEYQQAVLFLTTNKPESVDDAIASRCIARLTYDIPAVEDQARIWRVLVDQAGLSMTDEMIDKVTDEMDQLSGRDIKNLLKLAALLKPGQPLDLEAIQFAEQFRPTAGGDASSRD